jgi:transposase
MRHIFLIARCQEPFQSQRPKVVDAVTGEHQKDIFRRYRPRFSSRSPQFRDPVVPAIVPKNRMDPLSADAKLRSQDGNTMTPESQEDHLDQIGRGQLLHTDPDPICKLIMRSYKIILQLVHRHVTGQTRLIRILTSVPGIGYLAAVTLIAEIGDFRDFTSGDKLASWAGLVPTVNQSADHLRMGAITRRGSRTLRWILVEIAHAAVRTRSSRFYAFFAKKVGLIGFGKTIVAMARKIVTILWHLVVNDEEYEEPEGNRKQEIRIPKARLPKFLTPNEMLRVLAEANIFLKGSDPHRGE